MIYYLNPFLNIVCRSVSRGLPGVVSEDDLSVGEVARRNHDSAVHLQLLPKQDIDRPQGSSVFDSDENNNESDRSSSIHDGHNQVRNKHVIYICIYEPFLK